MSIEPIATYRVQLNPQFGFDAAAAITAYLSELGTSHLYCSPCMQAAPGSTHGYDVVDYTRVSEELGGPAAHERMCAALRAAGMGQLLDIVPNHMATTGRENPWWWDVLENGPASRYSAYFDVDWEPPEARLRNTLLLPILGDHYGRVLEAGEISLVRDGAEFTIRCYDRELPVAPRSLDNLLARAAERCSSNELAFIADALTALPFSTATESQSVRRRQRDVAVLKATIGRLIQSSPEVAAAIDHSVAEFNANDALLHAMLERQNYRLAFWRAAARDLGYRRFFDINTLIGLRMENDDAFADTHRVVLRWLLEGVLDGVRIDHIDGLRDPEGYLQRLNRATPQAWIVVEKILQPGERLRESWSIAGTTGYDFLNRVNGLFVDPAGKPPLTAFYEEFSGQAGDFASIAQDAKEIVARDILGSELNRLTALFVAVCENDRRHRDYTRHMLHEALVAVVARFGVYRTYFREDSREAHPDDVQNVQQAIDAAKADRPDLDHELFDFLGDILQVTHPGQLYSELALGFQQFTGPVMAKALEDTAFYRYHRLICLNEVGGDPACFGVEIEEFHRACQDSKRRWAHGLLATATHDTKRSEDVRARLALLSEVPAQWADAVRRWAALNQRSWPAEPDRNAEYLLYQTLAGAWPISNERIWTYMNKALREAKQKTSWTNPDQAYENNLKTLIDNILADRNFVDDLEEFVAFLAPLGWVNSLAQTLLKLTAPGIPDLYQGTELWDLSLVDPDNRRPVDYRLRHQLLQVLKSAALEEILRRMGEGLPKLWTICRALALRRAKPALFAPGAAYEPLRAEGSRADHVVAFMRGDGAITIVPRLVFKLGSRWEDTTLAVPAGRWRNHLTGEIIQGARTGLAQLMARFPVCLLVREEPLP